MANREEVPEAPGNNGRSVLLAVHLTRRVGEKGAGLFSKSKGCGCLPYQGKGGMLPK